MSLTTERQKRPLIGAYFFTNVSGRAALQHVCRHGSSSSSFGSRLMNCRRRCPLTSGASAALLETTRRWQRESSKLEFNFKAAQTFLFLKRLRFFFSVLTLTSSSDGGLAVFGAAGPQWTLSVFSIASSRPSSCVYKLQAFYWWKWSFFLFFFCSLFI